MEKIKLHLLIVLLASVLAFPLVYAQTTFSDIWSNGLLIFQEVLSNYPQYQLILDFFFFFFFFFIIYLKGAEFVLGEEKDGKRILSRQGKTLAFLFALATAFLMLLRDFSIISLLPYLHWILFVALVLFVIYLLSKITGSWFWRIFWILLILLLLFLLWWWLFNSDFSFSDLAPSSSPGFDLPDISVNDIPIATPSITQRSSTDVVEISCSACGGEAECTEQTCKKLDGCKFLPDPTKTEKKIGECKPIITDCSACGLGSDHGCELVACKSIATYCDYREGECVDTREVVETEEQPVVTLTAEEQEQVQTIKAPYQRKSTINIEPDKAEATLRHNAIVGDIQKFEGTPEEVEEFADSKIRQLGELESALRGVDIDKGTFDSRDELKKIAEGLDSQFDAYRNVDPAITERFDESYKALIDRYRDRRVPGPAASVLHAMNGHLDEMRNALLDAKEKKKQATSPQQQQKDELKREADRLKAEFEQYRHLFPPSDGQKTNLGEDFDNLYEVVMNHHRGASGVSITEEIRGMDGALPVMRAIVETAKADTSAAATAVPPDTSAAATPSPDTSAAATVASPRAPAAASVAPPDSSAAASVASDPLEIARNAYLAQRDRWVGRFQTARTTEERAIIAQAIHELETVANTPGDLEAVREAGAKANERIVNLGGPLALADGAEVKVTAANVDAKIASLERAIRSRAFDDSEASLRRSLATLESFKTDPTDQHRQVADLGWRSFEKAVNDRESAIRAAPRAPAVPANLAGVRALQQATRGGEAAVPTVVEVTPESGPAPAPPATVVTPLAPKFEIVPLDQVDPQAVVDARTTRSDWTDHELAYIKVAEEIINAQNQIEHWEGVISRSSTPDPDDESQLQSAKADLALFKEREASILGGLESGALLVGTPLAQQPSAEDLANRQERDAIKSRADAIKDEFDALENVDPSVAASFNQNYDFFMDYHRSGSAPQDQVVGSLNNGLGFLESDLAEAKGEDPDEPPAAVAATDEDGSPPQQPPSDEPDPSSDSDSRLPPPPPPPAPLLSPTQLLSDTLPDINPWHLLIATLGLLLIAGGVVAVAHRKGLLSKQGSIRNFIRRKHDILEKLEKLYEQRQQHFREEEKLQHKLRNLSLDSSGKPDIVNWLKDESDGVFSKEVHNLTTEYDVEKATIHLLHELYLLEAEIYRRLNSKRSTPAIRQVREHAAPGGNISKEIRKYYNLEKVSREYENELIEDVKNKDRVFELVQGKYADYLQKESEFGHFIEYMTSSHEGIISRLKEQISALGEAQTRKQRGATITIDDDPGEGKKVGYSSTDYITGTVNPPVPLVAKIQGEQWTGPVDVTVSQYQGRWRAKLYRLIDGEQEYTFEVESSTHNAHKLLNIVGLRDHVDITGCASNATIRSMRENPITIHYQGKHDSQQPTVTVTRDNQTTPLNVERLTSSEGFSEWKVNTSQYRWQEGTYTIRALVEAQEGDVVLKPHTQEEFTIVKEEIIDRERLFRFFPEGLKVPVGNRAYVGLDDTFSEISAEILKDGQRVATPQIRSLQLGLLPNSLFVDLDATVMEVGPYQLQVRSGEFTDTIDFSVVSVTDNIEPSKDVRIKQGESQDFKIALGGDYQGFVIVWGIREIDYGVNRSVGGNSDQAVRTFTVNTDRLKPGEYRLVWMLFDTAYTREVPFTVYEENGSSGSGGETPPGGGGDDQEHPLINVSSLNHAFPRGIIIPRIGGIFVYLNPNIPASDCSVSIESNGREAPLKFGLFYNIHVEGKNLRSGNHVLKVKREETEDSLPIEVVDSDIHIALTNQVNFIPQGSPFPVDVKLEGYDEFDIRITVHELTEGVLGFEIKEQIQTSPSQGPERSATVQTSALEAERTYVCQVDIPGIIFDDPPRVEFKVIHPLEPPPDDIYDQAAGEARKRNARGGLIDWLEEEDD